MQWRRGCWWLGGWRCQEGSRGDWGVGGVRGGMGAEDRAGEGKGRWAEPGARARPRGVPG